MRLSAVRVRKSEYFVDLVVISDVASLTWRRGSLPMLTEQKRYPGVEGKTVEYVRTRNEGDTLYFHIRFTDKTFLGISVAPSLRCTPQISMLNPRATMKC